MSAAQVNDKFSCMSSVLASAQQGFTVPLDFMYIQKLAFLSQGSLEVHQDTVLRGMFELSAQQTSSTHCFKGYLSNTYLRMVYFVFIAFRDVF